MMKAFVEKLLRAGVDGLVLRVEVAGELVMEGVGGAGVEADSWFDLASLTKPFVGTLAARLDALGLLPLDQPIGGLLPGLSTNLAKRTLEDLLRHRSGLSPWLPFYRWVSANTSPLDLVLDPLRLTEADDCYSDLGYLLWGWLAERATKRPLAELVGEYVLEPLGLAESSGAIPGAIIGIVPCRLDNRVEVKLAAALGTVVSEDATKRTGIPQDGNARYLADPGTLLGHCGLFGSAAAVAALGSSWLTDRLLSVGQRRAALEASSRFAMGWWRATSGSRDPSTSIEAPLTPACFGMVGFTGGSCWVDPERQLVAVLLAHRRSTSLEMSPWRRRFHELAVSVSDR